MTIAEFLLARIAEEEHPANPLLHLPPERGGERVARRIRAECAAKRAIVERETSQRTYPPGALPNVEMTYSHNGRLAIQTPDGDELLEGPQADEWLYQYTAPVTDTPTLRLLAAVYADHPDYRQEWKP